MCLDEIKAPLKHSITCPNCRVLTENVICTKNLPENDRVFLQNSNQGGFPFGGFSANLNSPYENAKRLERECNSLISTGDRFLQYLSKIEEQDAQAEEVLRKNYEAEFEKVETVSKMVIQMITDYKTKLQT